MTDMKYPIIILTALSLLGAADAAAQKLEDRQSMQKELAFPAGSSLLEIWNLNGSVTVEAYEGSSILIQVEKIITADGQKTLQTGGEEIGFEAITTADKAIVRMTGPGIRWTGEDSDPWWKGESSEKEQCNSERGYSFVLNFRIQVPADTDLKVSTVNQGDIRVRGLRASHLQAGNVNGGITLEDVTGKTKADAINGDVRITYYRNPDEGSEYNSLNGDLEIGFREGLSADIGFKSMNGEIFTDFDVMGQYAKTGKEKSKGPDKGRFKYESTPVIRIGSGEVMHQIETLNGNVYLKKI
jgi:hypothetical protein